MGSQSAEARIGTPLCARCLGMMRPREPEGDTRHPLPPVAVPASHCLGAGDLNFQQASQTGIFEIPLNSDTPQATDRSPEMGPHSPRRPRVTFIHPFPPHPYPTKKEKLLCIRRILLTPDVWGFPQQAIL